MTFKTRLEEQHGFSSYVFYNDAGLKVPRGFTEETGLENAEKFCILLNAHYDEAVRLTVNYLAALQMNMDCVARGEKGKERDAFNQIERFLNRLQKEAGIRNS